VLLYIFVSTILPLSMLTILSINANLLPDIQMFGLSLLPVFVAATFTIALAPYLVLTSYTLRVATVANRTAGTGPFTIHT
jgi:hypothetical protein